MFFFFPFGFLFSIFLIFFAVRIGLRIFQNFTRGVDRTDQRPGWLTGSRSWLPAGWKDFGALRPLNMEARIFRIAYKRKGRITISDVVLETGLSIKEAEDLVNGMVDGMRVRMEVDPNGMVVYEFPEIIARFERQ